MLPLVGPHAQLRLSSVWSDFACAALLQEFKPSPGSLGKSITIGDFARDILLDQVSRAGAAAVPRLESAGRLSACAQS